MACAVSWVVSASICWHSTHVAGGGVDVHRTNHEVRAGLGGPWGAAAHGPDVPGAAERGAGAAGQGERGSVLKGAGGAAGDGWGSRNHCNQVRIENTTCENPE